jgi:hypothetical protein
MTSGRVVARAAVGRVGAVPAEAVPAAGRAVMRRVLAGFVRAGHDRAGHVPADSGVTDLARTAPVRARRVPAGTDRVKSALAVDRHFAADRPTPGRDGPGKGDHRTSEPGRGRTARDPTAPGRLTNGDSSDVPAAPQDSGSSPIGPRVAEARRTVIGHRMAAVRGDVLVHHSTVAATADLAGPRTRGQGTSGRVPQTAVRPYRRQRIWGPTRSSSPVADRSRRRSSHAVRRSVCWWYRSAGRRSRNWSCMPRTCASRSWRSRAVR